MARASLLCAALIAGCVPANDLTRAPPPPAPTVDAHADTAAPPPLPSGKLPPTARPLRYEVSLAIDPSADRFTGDVSITVEVPAATPAIVLHGSGLTILRAEVIADGQSHTAKTSFRRAAGAKGAEEELVLALGRPLRPGRAEIRIAYGAPFNGSLSGLYRVKQGSDSYAFTQLEPSDARRLLPCFDEPGFKTPFDLKVTTPRGNIVVANTAESERSPSEDGHSVTFHFAPTPPLSTYLLALAVGPLEIREAREPVDGVKVRLVTTQGKSIFGDLALEAASTHLRALGDYFGRPYPYPKLDILAVPELGAGSTENAGLASFREGLILVDPKTAGAEARRVLATSVAHELTHHWFGDLVTLSSWDDLWLSEGFATLIAGKIVDASRPGTDARLSALLERGAAMRKDGLASARAVRQKAEGAAEADESEDGFAYEKSAAVLGMLEGWVSAEAFREGVRAYLKGHEHGVATSADLFQALSAASGKKVWPVAATFVDQPGLPLVRAELSCDKGAARVKLAQERYKPRRGAAADATWKIPICIDYEGSDKAPPACGLLDGPTGEVALPASAKCPRFIYPNAREEGYFRFALPPAQMAALAGQSRSLDARARIGLIGNAWALVQSGDMNADALLDLLAEQKAERHRLVLEQAVTVLEGVSATIVDDGARPAFRRYVAELFLPLARDLGWEAKKGESEDARLLRLRVLSALETLGEDPWVTAEAEKRAAAYWKAPRPEGTDLAEIAVRASSRRAGDKRFVELLERARRQGSSPEEHRLALRALGSFADPPLLRRALDLVLAGDLKGQDGFAVFDAATAYSESRPILLAWVQEHFAELKAKMPDFLLPRLPPAAGSLCDAKAREEAARVFGEALKGTPGAARALEKELEAADICIEVRGREAPRVKRRFEARRPLAAR